MRVRRIFRPAYRPRRWGTAVAMLGGFLVVAGLAMVLPATLFGSAPRGQSWRAASSEVRVVDGETLRLGDRVLRLAGLAAPERGRPCADGNGQTRDCGAAAAAALAGLVASRDLDCAIRGQDRHGRALGLCSAGGVEVNGSMVAAGWARAEGSAEGLAPLEAAARAAGRGQWALR